MSKRRRRKLAMARRRARERAARPDPAGVIRARGSLDGTTEGRPAARFAPRRLRAPVVPSVVDAFFLASDGPRLVAFQGMRRLVVSDPLRSRVVRWFELTDFARGVAVDPDSGGMVVFGRHEKQLTGSRWDPEDGLVHLEPIRTYPRFFACDQAGGRIHALGDEGLVSWSYRRGRLVEELRWSLPELPEYTGWRLRAAAAVPGTRAVAALFVQEEAFADRNPVRGYRLLHTDIQGRRQLSGIDLGNPSEGSYTGLEVLPPGVAVATSREGPLALARRLEDLEDAVAVIGRVPLRRGTFTGKPLLMAQGFTPGGLAVGGTYLVDPTRGAALAAEELPASWAAAPARPVQKRRGFLGSLQPPRLVVGRQVALAVEDTGPTMRLTRLGPEGAQVLAEVPDASIGGIAVDDAAGELVANVQPHPGRGRGDAALSCWDLVTGEPREARRTMSVYRGIRALAPDGSWVLGFEEDRGTLLARGSRERAWSREVRGTPEGIQPGWARRCWVAPGGGIVLLAWRVEGQPGENSTRRILLPEGDVTLLEGRNLAQVAYDPTGQRAALVIGSHELQLWSRDTDEPVPSGLDLEGAAVADLAFTPDGRFLVVAPHYAAGRLSQPELWLWDLRERARVGSIPVPEGAPAALGFSGDGRWLYLVVADGAAMAWEAEAVLAEARRR